MGAGGYGCSGLMVAEVKLVPFITGVGSGSEGLVELAWNKI